MHKIPTPHIGAKSKEEIAHTVIMPGDPKRADFIAKTYLTDVTCFNEVRGMLGFTGYYQGKRVSVMGSGMGIPSSLIYYHELFALYDVEAIIRVGTAGALKQGMRLSDVVIATAAHSPSAVLRDAFAPCTFAPTPDFGLLRKAVEYAENNAIQAHIGTVLSSDEFYGSNNYMDKLIQAGTIAVEMESAGLFLEANRLGKKALGVFTISDSPDEVSTAQTREKSYTQMMELALTIAPE